MNKFLLMFLSSVFVLAMILSCAKDKVQPNIETPMVCMDTIHYSTVIVPIVQQNCSTTGCHDATASGGYSFLTYSDVSYSAEIMLRSMKHESGVEPMPFAMNKLSDATIQQFECWLNQGKLNN